MRPISINSVGTTEQTTANRLRQEARRFVDSLGNRLSELERLSQLAHQFDIIWPSDYVEFKQLFHDFSALCEEFQVLSKLTESSLTQIDNQDPEQRKESASLERVLRELQAPMLQAMIRTNLRLLKMWDLRVRSGESLPYGSRELFQETVRIIDTAKQDLLRPRYLALLDEDAVKDAEEADRLLKSLLRQTPKLFEFVQGDSFDDELLNLINGIRK